MVGHGCNRSNSRFAVALRAILPFAARFGVGLTVGDVEREDGVEEVLLGMRFVAVPGAFRVCD